MKLEKNTQVCRQQALGNVISKLFRIASVRLRKRFRIVPARVCAFGPEVWDGLGFGIWDLAMAWAVEDLKP